MSLGMEVPALLGGIKVYTTDGRGFTPEELSERALDKIIHVSNQTDPVIREQANAYRTQIKRVLEFYMHEAIDSYKVTLTAELDRQGQGDTAKIIRNI